MPLQLWLHIVHFTIVWWQPARGRDSQGRPDFIFIDSLMEDVDWSLQSYTRRWATEASGWNRQSSTLVADMKMMIIATSNIALYRMQCHISLSKHLLHKSIHHAMRKLFPPSWNHLPSHRVRELHKLSKSVNSASWFRNAKSNLHSYQWYSSKYSKHTTSSTVRVIVLLTDATR